MEEGWVTDHEGLQNGPEMSKLQWTLITLCTSKRSSRLQTRFSWYTPRIRPLRTICVIFWVWWECYLCHQNSIPMLDAGSPQIMWIPVIAVHWGSLSLGVTRLHRRLVWASNLYFNLYIQIYIKSTFYSKIDSSCHVCFLFTGVVTFQHLILYFLVDSYNDVMCCRGNNGRILNWSRYRVRLIQSYHTTQGAQSHLIKNAAAYRCLKLQLTLLVNNFQAQ